MTPTAFAFVYRPGPAWIRDRPLAEQKLGPHARYMGELFARGRLLLGGPFLDTGGGFALVAADTEDEAREIFERDPAIVDGVFAGDVRSWCAVFDRHDPRVVGAQPRHGTSRVRGRRSARRERPALAQRSGRHHPPGAEPSVRRQLSRPRRSGAPRRRIHADLGPIPGSGGASGARTRVLRRPRLRRRRVAPPRRARGRTRDRPPRGERLPALGRTRRRIAHVPLRHHASCGLSRLSPASVTFRRSRN
jgi:uncharacterized protein YciI